MDSNWGRTKTTAKTNKEARRDALGVSKHIVFYLTAGALVALSLVAATRACPMQR